MSDDLEVTAGRSPVEVAVEDLLVAARMLSRATDLVDDAASGAGLAVVDDALAASVALSPLTGSAAHLALQRAALAAALLPAEAAALARGTVLTAQLYAEADRAVAALADAAAAVTAVVLVSQLPALGLVGMVLQADGVPVFDGLRLVAAEHPDRVLGAVERTLGGVVPALPVLLGWVGDTSNGLLLQERGVAVVRPAGPPTTTPPSRGLGGVVAGLAEASSAAGPRRVRVAQLEHADGRRSWVVLVPGTDTWAPVAGRDPHDLTSNLRLVAEQETLLAAGVGAALDDAQAAAGGSPSDEVMLVGHSQGGLVAATLAATPTFTSAHRVTQVVTVGSPTARIDVPASTSVLSVEHVRDLVPRLDGETAARGERRVTVRRDAAADQHGLRTYAETVAEIDRSQDPALVRWRVEAEPFLGEGVEQVVVRDYVVERAVPGAVAGSGGSGGAGSGSAGSGGGSSGGTW